MQKSSSGSASRQSSQKKSSRSTGPTLNSRQQNIKNFKSEIDHEIAKCLDTLDRQGLKYLRETLRASEIFGISELESKRQLNEAKDKDININCKSESKLSSRKEPIPETRNEQIATNTNKNSVKKDSKSNTKKVSAAAKRNQYAKVSSEKLKAKNTKDKNTVQKQPIDHEIIEEEIQQQQEIVQELTVDQQHNPNKFEQKQSIQSLQVFPCITEPLRPFSNKNTRPSNNIKNYGTVVPGDQQILQMPEKLADQSINKPEQKIIQEIQVTLEDKQKSEIDTIVRKIKKLPQQKLKQLGRLIDRLENSERFDDMNEASRVVSRPYMQSSNASHSRSGKLRKNSEKATSLHDQIMVKNKQKVAEGKGAEGHNEDVPEEQMFQYQNNKSQEPNSRNVKIQSYASQPAVTKINPSFQPFVKVESPSKIFKKKPMFSDAKPTGVSQAVRHTPLQIDMTESRQSNFQYPEANAYNENQQEEQKNIEQLAEASVSSVSQTKMIRIGKKKLGTNKVEIVLLKNNGHPSIIGLTGIEFYNCIGKVIPVTVANMISTNSLKLAKLFNGCNLTTDPQNMFTAVHCKGEPNRLQFDIPQKIGGIRIWNYNKSEIESDKETNELQIIINDRSVWRGQINKGSYSEIKDYHTQICIEPLFEFPSMQSDQEVKQQKTSSDEPGSKLKEWLQISAVNQSVQEQIQSRREEPKDDRQAEYKEKEMCQVRQTIEFDIMKKSNSELQHSRIATMSKKDPNSPLRVPKEPNSPLRGQKQPKLGAVNIEQEFDILNSLKKSSVKHGRQTTRKVQEPIFKVDKDPQQAIPQIKGQKQPDPPAILPQVKQTNSNSLIQKPAKLQTHQKSLQQFMNDSIFQEPVIAKKNTMVTNKGPSIPQQPKVSQISNNLVPQMVNKPARDLDLSQFLNELDDLVGEPKVYKKEGSLNSQPNTTKIVIPETPKGQRLTLTLESNWGDFHAIGLNKIQLFDTQGQQIYPSSILNAQQLKEMCLSKNTAAAMLFSKSSEPTTKNEQQWKCKYSPGRSIEIKLEFSKMVEFALIRIWNYIGDRVHSGCGVKRMRMEIDGGIVFMGELRKSLGTSKLEIYKSYECVLFTNNAQVHKKIQNSDWLYLEMQSRSEQRVVFRESMQHFHRPVTKGGGSEQEVMAIDKNLQIKMPKRQCFQYDSPTLPKCYSIRIVMHTTWGDTNFIGLNGLTIFDGAGQAIDALKGKVSEHPVCLSSLPGHESDKRNVRNLFNGKNFNGHESNTWLAPYISDLEKLDGREPNTFLIQLKTPSSISGINFYNYLKDPCRGVRQIEIFCDHTLAFRGYLRMLDPKQPQYTHTTVTFTKQQQLLQKMHFLGYHQDNRQQHVLFYNEGKIVK